MTMRPLQDQVTDIAVFGLSVAFLGFMTKMVRGDFAGTAVGEVRKSAVLPQPSLLPQTYKEQPLRDVYEERAHQLIDSIQKAIDETDKSASIKRIERVLGKIDAELLERKIITGVDDLRNAIKDYRAITREGLPPEEYQEEKESAFEEVMEAADGLDIDEDVLDEFEEEDSEEPPPIKPPVPDELRLKGIATLDRLIKEKKNDSNWEKWSQGSVSDARKAVYKDILDGFSSLGEAREYVEGMPDDKVIFTARGDEISFWLIKLIIADIERNPWLSPFIPERP